jgi:hypothetical protein
VLHQLEGCGTSTRVDIDRGCDHVVVIEYHAEGDNITSCSEISRWKAAMEAEVLDAFLRRCSGIVNVL